MTNRNSTLVTRRRGKVAIIGNCPPVSCIYIARPTQSPGLFTQMVGRGLRLASGKTDCLVMWVTGRRANPRLVTLVDMMPSALCEDVEPALENPDRLTSPPRPQRSMIRRIGGLIRGLFR